MSSRPSTNQAAILSLCLAAAGCLVADAPCDIYSAGGTPCIAAHSTTRALYGAYTGISSRRHWIEEREIVAISDIVMRLICRSCLAVG